MQITSVDQNCSLRIDTNGGPKEYSSYWSETVFYSWPGKMEVEAGALMHFRAEFGKFLPP